MPNRIKTRRAQAERELREKAELDVLLLQCELDRRQHEKPPLCRLATAQWDWRCRCGNLVWAGRKHCLMCNSARAQGGYTMTGSVKGEFQSTSAVLHARGNQRLVPGDGLQHASGKSRGQPNLPHASAKRGGSGDTTHREASQRPSTFLEAARMAMVAPNSAAVSNPAAQLLHEENDIQEADEIDVDPTIPEDVSYDDIRRSLRKFESVLQRGTKRHGNKTALVADKQQLIAAQQAELVGCNQLPTQLLQKCRTFGQRLRS